EKTLEEVNARAATFVAELATAEDDGARKTIKKRLPAWCSAEFRAGGRRLSNDFVARGIAGLDCDEVTAATWDDVVAQIRAKLPGLFVAMHTTATERNPDGTWRVRPYVVLDRPASKDEWESRIKPWMRSLGIQDTQALDAVRLHYLPIRTAGYRFAVIEGA